MTNPMVDIQARKLLLLTRIAAERQELTADLRQFRRAASLPTMLRSAIGPGFLSDLLGKKRGGGSAGGGWLSLALSLVQRYRVAATLVGSVLPMIRRRHGERRGRGLRRVLLLAVVGGAAFAGWKFSRPGGAASPGT